MNIELHDINEKLLADPNQFLEETDLAYQKRLSEIADDIALHRAERPIILLSGPSGSGKTTTAHMIEQILDDRGIETHTLSLDNYFHSLTDEEKLLFAEGKLDLESPRRIDSVFLSEQLTALEEGRPVELPEYDFKESARKMSGRILQRKPGELVILEGIHSLNPDVIRIPDELTARIYISVRTRITADGEVLHPSKIRLMRRMVRDRLFRKRSLQETLMMFRSVEEGENKYIMPYKYRSTYDVDTFMAYEICAYKPCLSADFQSMLDEPEIQDADAFLTRAAALSSKQLPENSLIREFVGF
ncbi:MAG: adenylyl-sulfate kinase [Oscillospiraceae bacterium]|nr:adenylyl-sulfate kinase [Oscillospiraceae bacterium]